MRSPVRRKPSLKKWHRALQKISNKAQLLSSSSSSPSSPSDAPLFLAWRGDKLLGAAAARAVEKTTSIRTQGDATKLLSRALSNRYFAAHVATLLPDFPLGPTDPAAPEQHYSHRQLGSLLEAVVAHVSDDSSATDSSQSHEAIDELAEWLVHTSLQELSESNPKGRLLELGGTVKSIRIGGKDHRPFFQATVRWKEFQIVHGGYGSRYSVERDACRKIMTLGEDGADTGAENHDDQNTTQPESGCLSNPKGRLLELGGTVGSVRAGGEDHRPYFTATARWNEYQIVHSGYGSKKATEQEACRKLIQQTGEYSNAY